MKVALFGGAFDPPHLGHQRVAEEMIKHRVADEVRFVPVKNHAFDKKMSSAEHRLAMCGLITNGQIRVETYELDNTGVSYSHKTLRALSAAEPENEFFWVIGSDNLASFHKWGDYQQLLAEFRIYVYPRQKYSMEPLRKGMVVLSDMPEVAVSSTLVREKIKTGESVIKLADEKIVKYIKENGLYHAKF
ncbi:nicotinate (nicotinamide) nucleotide adenylyltransferase [Patescibacteria group bacterium]|nr:nicotinate (nicotinamide) nucleotide adenylyltransferase [Patescibacteria group bacterium]